MATETLLPGAVTVGANLTTPGVVVGAPPQWADGSDATYATTYRTARPGVGVAAEAQAPLPLLTADPATVTAITLHARFSTSNSGTATQRQLGIGIVNSLTGIEVLWLRRDATNAVYQAPADSLIHEVSLALTPYDLAFHGGSGTTPGTPTTLLAVATKLTQPFNNLWAIRYRGPGDSGSFDYGITVYEASIEVTYAGGEPERLFIRRPLRMHPRSDALGMSSTRRYGTNPRSIQASLRRGGGTYI